MELDTSGWPNLIGFAGKARSGKDTAASFLEKYGYKRYAFGDKVREALAALDPLIRSSVDGRKVAYLHEILYLHSWEGVKDSEFAADVRRHLQRMGTEVGREVIGKDVWIDQVLGDTPPTERMVISDVRFANETERIYKLGGYVIMLDRPDVTETSNSNHASEGLDLHYHYHILNDSSKQYLEHLIVSSLNVIGTYRTILQ